MKWNDIFIPSMLLALAVPAQAAIVSWGGAGSQASPEFWNLGVNGSPGRNDDPTHWNQASPPDLTGADDAVIHGGGIQKNGGHAFSGGSAMTLNSGAYFVLNTTTTASFTMTSGASLILNNGTFESNTVSFTAFGGSSLTINSGTFQSNTNFVTFGASSLGVANGSFVFAGTSTSGLGLNDGATATVSAGGVIESTTFFNSQNQNFATGGTFVLDGGTLLASGAQADPLRATNGLDGGGFDFTALGGTIQIDNFTGGSLTAYLESRATGGFFKIDGTTVSGFGAGNAINGEYIALADNGGAGSLLLVPEPSTALLAGLGMLALFRRRR